MKMNRTLAVAAAGAATVLVGAGAAFAGLDGSEQRGARCEALVAKIAEKHGVSVAELEARIKERLTARVEAALRAGRIGADRAAQLEKRIAEGRLCQGARMRAKVANRGLFAAAASFLGMSRAELRAALPGTSLAALAAKQGKSVDALEAAMLDRVEAKLAKAVEAKRLTEARAERLLERLSKLVDRLVAKTFRATDS
jgi:hypothetical protein